MSCRPQLIGRSPLGQLKSEGLLTSLVLLLCFIFQNIFLKYITDNNNYDY